MKFFMINENDYYDKEDYFYPLLINVSHIIYFDIFEKFVRIYFTDDYQIEVTIDCYNSLLAFIQSI